MARVRPLIVARKLSGYVAPGADVYIYERDDTEDVSAHAKDELTLYTTEAGGTTIAQPLQTDSRGIVEEFWMESQSYDRRIVAAGDDFIVHDEALTAADLGGRELDYAEIVTAFSTTGTHTTAQDVTGLEITVDVGVRPIIVEFGAPSIYHVSTGGATVTLYEGVTLLGGCTSIISVASKEVPAYCRARLTPSPGSHTYKVTLKAQFVNAAAVINAGVGFPAWLQATEV